MREFEVLKPFNTVNRRLKVGSVITEALNLSPFTFEDREKRGFIKPKNAAPPAPAAAAVPPVNKFGGGAAAALEPAGADGK